jgi:hypothetical protein
MRVATPFTHATGSQFVTDVGGRSEISNGYSLGNVSPEIETLIGNPIERIIADEADRRRNAPSDYKVGGLSLAGDGARRPRSGAKCADALPSNRSSDI